MLSVVRGLDVYSIDQFYQQLYRPDLVREKLAGDPHGLVRAAAAKMNLDIAIASGPPPEVKIISPKEGVRVDAGRVKAEIDLTDRGGGIGRIEWRVNGVTKGVVRADHADHGDGKIARSSLDLDLLPGENRIEVTVYNGRDLVASIPISVTINVKSNAVAAGAGKLYVLAIGINDYSESRLKLDLAVPDARSIIEAFAKAKGDLYTNVEPKLVLDSEVSAEELDRAFAEITAKIQPQDTFVLFMSGHGKTVDGRYYYAPRDFHNENEGSIVKSGIGQDRFQAWLAKIKATRSVLLFDTCESGSMTGDRLAQRGLERVVAMEKMTQAMGRAIIAASADDAPAIEGYRGHGLFTYSVLQAFGEADADKDGKIEVTELIAYVDRVVPELADKVFHDRQVPQTKFTGANFPLVTRTSVLPADENVSDSAIPRKPTHMVISAAEVFAEPGGHGRSMQKLPQGSLVSVVRTEQGWVLVARDGKKVGYVAENALAKMQ